MALGRWDTSVAQALAAEVSERRLANIQYEQEHGMTRAEVDAGEHERSRQARELADHIAREIYGKLKRLPEGRAALDRHLANPALCSSCLNLKQPLVLCLNRCGRRLCTNCKTALGICTNIGVCRQKDHPTVWRAGVKVIDQNDELYKQWKKAADDADKYIKHTRCGRYSDGHPAETSTMHNNLIGRVIDRWERTLSGAAGQTGTWSPSS